MTGIKKNIFHDFDWISAASMVIICAFASVILYAQSLASDDQSDLLNFKKQVIFILVGLVIYFAIALFFDYRILPKISNYLYFAGLITLLCVIFFGTTIRGTTGWFVIGPFSLQPVEFAKIILIIYLAQYLTSKAKYLHQTRHLIASAVGTIVMIAIVLLQPDFGSSVILFATWLGLILVTGIKKSHLAILISIFVAALVILWLFVFADYQKNRVLVFLNPELDPLGTGYNITQATIAIGSGELVGRGLSFGSQSKLKFLPESQTDFIFAVIAENLGFVGGGVLLILYSVIIWRMLDMAKDLRDNFALFIILGICIVLSAQIFINMGMNLGLLPVTGLPLPLVSYGGSSLIATMTMLGLAQAIRLRKN